MLKECLHIIYVFIYRARLGSVLLVLLLAALCAENTRAQSRSGYQYGPLSISGSVGFSTETYGVNGIESRRPGASGRIFANASASAYGMSYNVDMDLSTEENEFRQSLSRLGIATSYKWIRLVAGDARPRFSRYGVQGVNVRGGLLELTPGDLIVAFSAGRTKRAIEPAAGQQFIRPSYAQWLYSAKAGYGKTTTNHLHITGAVIKDKTNSLPSDNLLNVEENASLSAQFGVKALNDRLFVQGNTTLSGYTRDARQQAIQGRSFNPVLGLFIDERPGTSVDYAGNLDVSFTEEAYTLKGGYERIQPGFRSLGISHLRNDQEQFSFQPQIRLLNRRLRLGLILSHARNNLQNNLNSTTVRNQYGLNSQARVTENLTVSMNYRLLTNQTNPVEDAVVPGITQTSHNIVMAPSYNWQAGDISQMISLSSNLQFFSMHREISGETLNNDFTNISNNVNYMITFPTSLNLNGSVRMVTSRSSASDTFSFSSSIGAGYTFLEGKLNTGLTAGFTGNHTEAASAAGSVFRTSQFTMNGNASYLLPWGDTLRFNFRTLGNRGRTSNFQEAQATLQLTHRF